MQSVLRALVLVCFVSVCVAVSGCGGSGGDEVLDYDPKVSEERRGEYEAQMKSAMQQQGRPVSNGE